MPTSYNTVEVITRIQVIQITLSHPDNVAQKLDLQLNMTSIKQSFEIFITFMNEILFFFIRRTYTLHKFKQRHQWF